MPLTMTQHMEDAIRGLLARNPDHVSRNSKTLLAELDAERAAHQETRVKLTLAEESNSERKSIADDLRALTDKED